MQVSCAFTHPAMTLMGIWYKTKTKQILKLWLFCRLPLWQCSVNFEVMLALLEVTSHKTVFITLKYASNINQIKQKSLRQILYYSLFKDNVAVIRSHFSFYMLICTLCVLIFTTDNQCCVKWQNVTIRGASKSFLGLPQVYDWPCQNPNVDRCAVSGRVLCFTNPEHIVEIKKIEGNTEKNTSSTGGPCHFANLLDIVNLPYNPFSRPGGIFARLVYIELQSLWFFLSVTCQVNIQ